MNKYIKVFIALLLVGYVYSEENISAKEKPNIVFFFIDDMGFGDIGPFGSENLTPQLDKLASEGMKLTSFYVSSTACTPSRSALLTGCYADYYYIEALVRLKKYCYPKKSINEN